MAAGGSLSIDPKLPCPFTTGYLKEKSCDNSECGKQHKQLKEWLLELKQYKEFIANRNIENMLLDFESQNNVFKMSIEEIYKKGIVDTLNILKNGKL